ncbi:uncharacterized protein EDB93DRAFT_789740 [Suillus bovinus]|uniref:uncharacterized protein n=1 Tax=Suillus bovinus TaxID=48563 RepID=UPI001B873B3F|nr:uncharacterized protein EDB93DRAFT_789740 [Suillus bovinus]KAG2136068.1 hypothetical protein EDB93DRAFT_789740 [Suillus bovinus]
MEKSHVCYAFFSSVMAIIQRLPYCALILWFKLAFGEPDPLWMVKSSFLDSKPDTQELSIIHIDTFVRAAHLRSIFGGGFVQEKTKSSYFRNSILSASLVASS